ncbi:hypothetical protein [Eshraghiella crossota]|uniref:hypothetical protein n=1 Tax=Eshraghiella crossota TaxID=45851 RepID=UPI003AB4461B
MKKKFLLTAILAATVAVAVPTAMTQSADAATTDASSASVTSMTATAAQSGKWIHGGGWWYQYADGTYPKDCFAKINGKTYYFDHSGYMVTGWKELDYNTYYFDSNGVMVTGWQSIGGKWYHFDEYGCMATYITYVNDKQQVFAPSGQWVSGWTFDRKIYYNDDGIVDWDRYNWYYANSDGTPYDYNKNDNINGGWLRYGGKWYYIDYDGEMLRDQIVNVYGKKYRLKDDGSMVTGWYQSGSEWYYSNADGTIYDGWLYYGKDWYYIDDGKMQTGWVTSKGKGYYLGIDGKLVSGWYHYNYKVVGYSNEYWMYMNTDGSRYTGWVSSGGKWHYINSSTMLCDEWDDCVNIEHYRKSDGEIDYDKYYEACNKSRGYVFDKTGAMVTGWYRTTGVSEGGKVYGSSWYYMDSDGQGHQGWLYYNGSWYYFVKGKMQTNCIAPDGSYLGADGISRKIR